MSLFWLLAIALSPIGGIVYVGGIITAWLGYRAMERRHGRRRGGGKRVARRMEQRTYIEPVGRGFWGWVKLVAMIVIVLMVIGAVL